MGYYSGKLMGMQAGDGNWWNAGGTVASCIAAYQPKGANSYAISKQNLVGNTLYDLTEVGGGAVYWSANNGWYGFRTLSRCLDTNITTFNNSWSLIIRCSGATTNNTVILGAYTSAGDGLYIAYMTVGGWQCFNQSYNYKVVPSLTGGGVLAFTGANIYLDGENKGNLGVQYTNGLTRSPYIGAQHYTSAVQHTDANIQAVAFYNTILTAQNIVDITTAMNVL